jgi:hypothetical protein
MVQSLAVTAYELNLDAKFALRGEDGVGVQLSEKKTKPRQLSNARLLCIHCRKHSRPNFGRIWKISMSNEFNCVARALLPAWKSS